MSNTGNTQQIIDYGAAPNDGTGDPLRTAFIKTDENFSNIWLAGPVGSNITIANNVIQSNNTNGNIVISPNGIGVLQVNASILPDITQVRDLGSANTRFRSIYFTGNIDTQGNFTVGGLTVNQDAVVQGNLTVNGTTLTVNVANLDITDKMIVIANGSSNTQEANGAGITIAGANATITYSSSTDSWDFNKTLITGNIVPSGNSVYSLGNSTNYWSNLWVSSNTIYIGGIPLGMAGNVLTVDGEIVLSNNSNSTITTTGDITAGYFIGDGSQLTNLPSSGSNTGSITFANTTISAPNGSSVAMEVRDNTGIVRSQLLLDPTTGTAMLESVSGPNDITFTSSSWSTAEWITAGDTGRVEFTGAPALSVWFQENILTALQLRASINGGSFTPVTQVTYGETVATIDTVAVPDPDPTVVTSVEFLYVNESQLRVGFDNEQIVLRTKDHQWTFDVDGNLTLPTIGSIVGLTPNNTGYLGWTGNSSGDGAGYTTLKLVPDRTIENNDQYIVIDPTAPQHVHIRAGGTQDNSAAQLFLGGEKNYVRVTDGSGVRLQNESRNDDFYSFSDPTDFNTATWYGTPGNYFVQYTAIDPQMGTLAFQFADDDDNRVIVYYGAGESSTLTYGGSSSNLGGGVYRFAVVEAPPSSPTALTGIEFEIWNTNENYVSLSNDDFTVEVDDDIRITGNDLFSLRNRSATDPITIRTDYDGADRAWEFGADGTLSTPGNIVLVGDIMGTAGASTLVLRAQPESNTSIQLNNTVDSTIRTAANLEIRTDVSNTAKTWTFDTLGDFNLPAGGNISGSGYVTARRIITDPTDLANLTAQAGARAFANDANLAAAGNFGAQVAGGGANTVPVWSDGVNWYIG